MPGPAPDAPDSSSVLLEGPWTHRVVRANGIALHVAELGHGPLVLLLHGFPQFWWAWHRQLVALADAGFRAVAVDLRGYGASDKPPRGYDIPTLTRDIAQLVTALGEQDATVVATDVSALLGWTMAARLPRVVRSLVVVGGAHPLQLRRALRHDAEQRAASRYAIRTFQVPRRPEKLLARDRTYATSLLEQWSGPRWRASPGYAEQVGRYAEAMRIHPVGYCAAECFRWLVRSQLRPDGRRFAEQVAGPVAAPVLQLHGALDSCVLPATAEGGERYTRGGYRWRLLDGVGHFPQDEVPGLVSEELVRWAAQH